MTHYQPTMAQKRILMVDDSLGQAELLTEALAEHGLRDVIHIETSADSALVFLTRQVETDGRHLPALVLVDLKLSTTTGIDLVQRIRSDHRFFFLPVIMFTTSDDPNDILSSYASGVNSYVIKPASFSDLVHLTRDLCHYWLRWNQVYSKC